MLAIAIPRTQTQTLTILHSFTGGADGAYPSAGITRDSAGNLYGTTYQGGIESCVLRSFLVGCGVVYRISRRGSGWVTSPLYSFGRQPDGQFPQARVIIGPDGALYGTTTQGGTGSCMVGTTGCGTVFKLQPPSSFCVSVACPWTETILYNFTSREDGFYPEGDVAFDSAGNLWGTTTNGGGSSDCPADGCGTVYELTRNPNGTWTKNTVHIFQSGTADGASPQAGIVFDQAGNAYGTTTSGGGSSACRNGGCGTVFELTPSGSGWSESVLYRFTGSADGAAPGQLVFDSSGNLWGPTSPFNGGTIFELTPQPEGGWSFSLQYTFTSGQAINPYVFTMDAAGNIYGSAPLGGADQLGPLYSLTRSASGWNYTNLYNFGYDTNLGWEPVGNIAFDPEGNIYGVNSLGPPPPYGTVWEFTP